MVVVARPRSPYFVDKRQNMVPGTAKRMCSGWTIHMVWNIKSWPRQLAWDGVKYMYVQTDHMQEPIYALSPLSTYFLSLIPNL